MASPVAADRTLQVSTGYYQQFDADLSAEVPGEGYGGWQTAELPLSLDHTAVVVMHAWDCGSPEDHPGWFRAVEYLPRSYEIARTVLPPLLAAARGAGLPVVHVVAGRDYWSHLPGALGDGTADPAPDRIPTDPVHRELATFRTHKVFPGDHNRADIDRGRPTVDFLPAARPVGDEAIAATSTDLIAHCRAQGINHLLYTGFAIDACLQTSPGGMVDMSRAGVMCSAVRQATTAVEHAETARDQLAKQIGLIKVAVHYGFVYDADALITALSSEQDVGGLTHLIDQVDP
ncbi:hypothetical protein ACQBAU_07010 [Propionibacteriaceae bacterium Y2011]